MAFQAPASFRAATLDRENGKLKFHVALNCKIILRTDEWKLRVVRGTEGTHANQSDLNLTKDSISVIFRQEMCVSDGGGVPRQ